MGREADRSDGIGDRGVSLWGEGEQQDGMQQGARVLVHPELIDPETGEALEMGDGATGELVTIDYDFPPWAEEYMSAVEGALGDAYSQPAAEVREFVGSIQQAD